MGQKIAGQDEERDRHDLEALDPGEELERHRLDRHLVITNRKLSTVRPSAIEIGMPVSISAISRPKMMALFIAAPSGQIAWLAAGLSTTPSTWPGSWCGSSPVRQNAQATCRKRKHIR